MSFIERTRPDLRQIARVLRSEEGIFEKPRDPLVISFKGSGRSLIIYEEQDFEEIRAMITGSQREPAMVLSPGLGYREEADLLAHLVGHVLLGHLNRYGIIIEYSSIISRDPKIIQQEREADYTQDIILHASHTKLKFFSHLPNRFLRFAARNQFWH